jgi:Uma2 family endonuclease
MSAEHAYVPNMTTPLMTAEQLPETSIPNKCTELVRGVLVVREPPGGRHGSVTMNLTLQLGIHVQREGAGQLLAAETGFTLFRGQWGRSSASKPTACSSSRPACSGRT